MTNKQDMEFINRLYSENNKLKAEIERLKKESEDEYNDGFVWEGKARDLQEENKVLNTALDLALTELWCFTDIPLSERDEFVENEKKTLLEKTEKRIEEVE